VVVVGVADQPTELLLDRKLKAIAFGDDRLNVAHVSFPKRVSRRVKFLGNEPDTLIGIWDKVRDVPPTVPLEELQIGT